MPALWSCDGLQEACCHGNASGGLQIRENSCLVSLTDLFRRPPFENYEGAPVQEENLSPIKTPEIKMRVPEEPKAAPDAAATSCNQGCFMHKWEGILQQGLKRPIRVALTSAE